MTNPQIKIPTLLGLSVLVVGLVIGVFLANWRQSTIFRTRASISSNPQNITVANISGTSASIYWQTEGDTSDFIQAGLTAASLDSIFNDSRDLLSPQNHRLHFVDLTNLKPDSTYYYKIISGSSVYPPDNPLSFKTASSQEPPHYQPIIGTILNPDLQPTNEALVTLEIQGAQKLAAVTKMAGNFILPLSEIRTSDLTKDFDLTNSSSSATLRIFDSQNMSKVLLHLPLNNSVIPIITLGQDLDLTSEDASPSAVPPKYDLNNDGVINSLDLSIVLQNFGKKNFNKRADLNNDGVVDQKDIDTISKFIPHTSLK